MKIQKSRTNSVLYYILHHKEMAHKNMYRKSATIRDLNISHTKQIEMYRIQFKNGIAKTFNMRNIAVMELNKNRITIKYALIKPNAKFIDGTGNIEWEFVEEHIDYTDTKEAAKQYEDMGDAMRRIE